MARDDLIPFSERSVDEAKKLGQKGGINSGIARRKKAAMKDVAAMVLGLKPALNEATTEQFKKLGIDIEEVTMQTLSLMKQNEKAIKGNLAALQFLRDTAGEKPTDKMEMSHAFIGDFDIVLDGEDED